MLIVAALKLAKVRLDASAKGCRSIIEDGGTEGAALRPREESKATGLRSWEGEAAELRKMLSAASADRTTTPSRYPNNRTPSNRCTTRPPPGIKMALAMNPKHFLKCQAAAILVLLTCTTVPLAAQVPELMWYQLDEGGGTVAMNAAPIATAVGNIASPVIGHELTSGVGCGGSGALRGFMGSVNYVDTGWLPAIPAGAPWSIGFFIDWSNISVPTSTPSYLVFATGGGQGSSTFITCTMAYNQSQNLYTGFTLERHDGTCFATTGSIVPVGRHLIVFTYDPSTTVIGVWVDAVLITSNWTLSSSLPGLSVGGTQTLRIGGRHENGGFGLPYDVILDDFRLFSHKLTPAEIASWYSSCPSWNCVHSGSPASE